MVFLLVDYLGVLLKQDIPLRSSNWRQLQFVLQRLGHGKCRASTYRKAVAVLRLLGSGKFLFLLDVLVL